MKHEASSGMRTLLGLGVAAAADKRGWKYKTNHFDDIRKRVCECEACYKDPQILSIRFTKMTAAGDVISNELTGLLKGKRGTTATLSSPTKFESLELKQVTEDPQHVLHNFIRMAVFFSGTVSCAIACLSLATARLGSLGARQSGLIYLAYTCSSVMGATSVANLFGARNAMIIGMALFCAYVACFLVATMDDGIARAATLIGAVLGGVGAGISWTAQGSYFLLASNRYENVSETHNWHETTILLAEIFAAIYLCAEATLGLLSSILELWCIPWSFVFTVYASIAVACTCAMAIMIQDYPNDETILSMSAESQCKIFSSTLRLLLRDPKMKYMIGYNAAMGLGSAFVNAIVSGAVVPVIFKDENSVYVGVLMAAHAAVAAGMSALFGYVSRRVGNVPVMTIGAICMITPATAFLMQPSLHHWNSESVIMIYVLHGTGRAVFEGTLKAVFAEYFYYEKEGAFANIILQNGLSCAVGYFLAGHLTCDAPNRYCIEFHGDHSIHQVWPLEILIIVAGLSSIWGFQRASVLFKEEEKARCSSESNENADLDPA
jgi:MFS family permease